MDVVNAEIDRLQTLLAPSLKMNHVKWVVFYDRTATADELTSGGSAEWIKYTTDHVKDVLSVKKAYMDKSYGSAVPTLSYTPYTASGAAKTGGIEYSVNVDGTLYTASDGAAATAGASNINAVYAHLTGEIADYFSVQYRVRIGADRWSPWVSDGKIAGASTSSGGKYYVKGIQMRLIQTADIQLYEIGDVNGDGLLTIRDLQAIKGFIAGLDGEYIAESADVNGDGLLTIADVSAMKKLIA